MNIKSQLLTGHGGQGVIVCYTQEKVEGSSSYIRFWSESISVKIPLLLFIFCGTLNECPLCALISSSAECG